MWKKKNYMTEIIKQQIILHPNFAEPKERNILNFSDRHFQLFNKSFGNYKK